jgi:L-asparagine transporter-like permease
MAIKRILLQAREYPSGLTFKRSKLNTDPNAAIKKAITDNVIRALKMYVMTIPLLIILLVWEK